MCVWPRAWCGAASAGGQNRPRYLDAPPRLAGPPGAAPPDRISSAASWRRALQPQNSNRIPLLSSGLAASAAYPGSPSRKMKQPQRNGVVEFLGWFPKVVRASQPWAESRSPVGAERIRGDGAQDMSVPVCQDPFRSTSSFHYDPFSSLT